MPTEPVTRRLYAVLPRRQWSALTPVRDSEGAVLVHDNELHRYVQDQTGRAWALAIRSVRDRLRRTGRVYVAADRDHGGGGLVIEQLNHPDIP